LFFFEINFMHADRSILALFFPLSFLIIQWRPMLCFNIFCVLLFGKFTVSFLDVHYRYWGLLQQYSTNLSLPPFLFIFFFFLAEQLATLKVDISF